MWPHLYETHHLCNSIHPINQRLPGPCWNRTKERNTNSCLTSLGGKGVGSLWKRVKKKKKVKYTLLAAKELSLSLLLLFLLLIPRQEGLTPKGTLTCDLRVCQAIWVEMVSREREQGGQRPGGGSLVAPRAERTRGRAERPRGRQRKALVKVQGCPEWLPRCEVAAAGPEWGRGVAGEGGHAAARTHPWLWPWEPTAGPGPARPAPPAHGCQRPGNSRSCGWGRGRRPQQVRDSCWGRGQSWLPPGTWTSTRPAPSPGVSTRETAHSADPRPRGKTLKRRVLGAPHSPKRRALNFLPLGLCALCSLPLEGPPPFRPRPRPWPRAPPCRQQFSLDYDWPAAKQASIRGHGSLDPEVV